jgi:Protein of unknown function (DUF1653)
MAKGPVGGAAEKGTVGSEVSADRRGVMRPLRYPVASTGRHGGRRFAGGRRGLDDNHIPGEMRMRGSIEPGRYRHYKGNDYTVLGVARHSETEEWLVVYRQEYGERALWVRPLAMFSEAVEVDGQTVPRFARIGSE